MTRLTAHCQVSALGVNIQRDGGVYQKILTELLQIVPEEKISALQLVPAGWPIKCKVTFTDESTKEDIVRTGISLFGKHVDFEDDNDLLIKLIVKDGHPEWPDDIFAANLCEYAKTVLTEKEMLYLNGRKTAISTGTRYVYVSEILKHIPPKIDFKVEDRRFPVTVWCPNTQNVAPENFRPVAPGNVSCTNCGGKHSTDSCVHKTRVCFNCKKDDHNNRDCPDNKGSKENEDVLLFYNSKCPLSNWSVEYTFKVDHIEYCCVEQFITVEKAYHFGDHHVGQRAMRLNDPKEIRDLGEKIRGFNRREWIDKRDEVMKVALKHKFSDPGARGAREFLLSTGNKTIGEASKHMYWGAGLVASHPDALNAEAWTGANTLGQMLMEIRNDIARESGIQNEESTPTGNVSDSFNENIRQQPKPTKYALVLGDANSAKLITNDETLPVKILDLSVPEMKFSDVKHVIDTCMVDKDSVDFIIMQTGLGHWHEGETIESAEEVLNEMKTAMSHSCTLFPKADFVVSAALLSDFSFTEEDAGKLKAINLEKMKYNNLAFDFARDERNVTFSDNSNICIKEDLPHDQEEHYQNSVLLSDEGKAVLQDNLKKGLTTAIELNALYGGSWTEVAS